MASNSINYGQVTVGATATLIVSADARRSIRIRNTHATVAAFLGDASVTSATGHSLPVGAEITLSADQVALYAITGSSGTVSFLEEV